MQDNREERIRERAHRFWEEEGRPEGKDREHWDKAATQIDSESFGAAGKSDTKVKPQDIARKNAGLP